MSEVIRKLSKRISVPEKYSRGVGETPTTVDGKEFRSGAYDKWVANAASRHLARFNDALSRYEATKQGYLEKNATDDPAKAEKVAEVAEYRGQKELDEMAELVRRFATEAGPDGSGAVTADMAAALGSLEKPKLAMILRRAGNPPLFQPLLGGDLADVPLLREGDKAVGVMKTAREENKIARKSSVASLPMVMRPAANIGNRAARDAFKPKDHDPMEFDAKDPGLSPKTQKYALNRLAGDQVAQAKAMEKGGGRLTVGAGASGDSDWVSRNSDSPNPDKGKPIDQVVERRNKGAFRKLAETIDRAGYDKEGNATEGTFDLDKYFPRWRARPGEVDESGKLAYPSRLPSAEYVTGMILGLHKFTEPGLYERWLPIVRRSIDAAPDEPSTPDALKYSKTVFKPSKKFQEVMKQGVGSKHYPYKIYGPRQVDLPPAEKAQAPQPKAIPAAEATQQRIERLRQSRAKPGNTDQSSIYMLPENSPMSGLLA